MERGRISATGSLSADYLSRQSAKCSWPLLQAFVHSARKPEYGNEWPRMRKLKAGKIKQLAQGHPFKEPAERDAQSFSDFAVKGI